MNTRCARSSRRVCSLHGRKDLQLLINKFSGNQQKIKTSSEYKPKIFVTSYTAWEELETSENYSRTASEMGITAELGVILELPGIVLKAYLSTKTS